MRLYLINFLIFLSSPLFAEEFQAQPASSCSEVRLDKKPNVMAEVPVQDQDGSLLCAAYVSSQLIDGWRAKNESPLKHVTSPIVLGVESAAKTNKTNLSLLSAPRILENANTYSSCSYDVINDRLNGEHAIDFMTEIHNLFAEQAQSPDKRSQAAQKIYNCMVRTGLASKTQISAQQIEDKIVQDNAVKFNQALFETICKNNSVKLSNIPPLKLKTSSSYKNLVKGMNEFRQVINGNLDTEKQPVAINFCREVFNDPSIRAVSENGNFMVNSKADPGVKKMFMNSPKGCSSEPHSSVVVGRRLLKYKNDKNEDAFVCQYLVRDSYGTSCNDYPPDASATPSERCEKGQVWVDEDALLANGAAVYHL